MMETCGFSIDCNARREVATVLIGGFLLRQFSSYRNEIEIFYCIHTMRTEEIIFFRESTYKSLCFRCNEQN